MSFIITKSAINVHPHSVSVNIEYKVTDRNSAVRIVIRVATAMSFSLILSWHIVSAIYLHISFDLLITI